MLGRFADGLGIGGVVLLPLDEGLDVGRRDQPHAMAQLADLASPVVRTCAGFHCDNTGCLCRQEPEKL